MSVPTILPLLRVVGSRLADDVSLGALATAARRSPFEVHRAFRRVTGETTKRYTARLRLERAAAQLLLDRADRRGRRSILEIALDSGFASHEVFTRAFLRRFQMSPRAYRARGLVGAPAREIAANHAAIVRRAGPCIGLFHVTSAEGRPEMSITVLRRQLDPRPALIIRRKIASSDVAKTLAEILPRVFTHAQREGIPLAGPPFTRYLPSGRGLIVIEGGFPIAAAATTNGEIEVIELPGGPAAVAIHVGPYERLSETHVALERWIEANKLETHGGAWETYLTDPGETPDPAEWQTEVVYPLSRT